MLVQAQMRKHLGRAAWTGSATPLSRSCPRLNLSTLLLESCPQMGFVCNYAATARHTINLCPIGAGRGSVDPTAWGWMRTSLALDAKRVYYNLCLTGARRGLVVLDTMLNARIYPNCPMGGRVAYFMCPMGDRMAYFICRMAFRMFCHAEYVVENLVRMHAAISIPIHQCTITAALAALPFFLRNGVDRCRNTSELSKDIQLLIGGGIRNGKFARELVENHIHNAHGSQDVAAASFMFEYQCTVQEVDAALLKSDLFISIRLPTGDLIPLLTRVRDLSHLTTCIMDTISGQWSQLCADMSSFASWTLSLEYILTPCTLATVVNSEVQSIDKIGLANAKACMKKRGKPQL
ncbi:hypothetical protein B0H17DRAFT_1147355 [Mycena rosella]|uniref:Uncharacterized protein n=1 Tax=Mycena rosella TaxID=1033263 RepID=A0AAD7CLX7_MYCRO|nr:hypothetical protein B0H17DRAFT_1147355 [Mycena rosella]